MMQKTTGGPSVADLLREARFALRAAHYDAALELLAECEDWEPELAEQAILIKAETIGQRDPVKAVEYLTTVEDIASTPAGRFSFAIQAGRSFAMVRNLAEAESRYAEARALVHAHPDGVPTMAFHDVRMRWYRRDPDVDAPEFKVALTHPDPSVVAAVYGYRAWLHAMRANYDAHVADLIKAVSFATVKAPEPVDVQTLACYTQALAQVGFETANAEAIAAARTASDAIAWTPDVQTLHYLTTRALGWDDFIRGRLAQAQWAFKDARVLAPTHAWRVMSHLDRAFVARSAGNEAWAIEELAEADRLARDVRWEAANLDESRQVLVMLAVLHAPIDAVRAQRYAATYSAIGVENLKPTFALNGDRRALGFARYAQGRIDQTLGRRDAAVSALTEAYEIFRSASFHYRATLAASALAELTGEERWRETAHEHARSYPDCPLAAMVDEAVSREEAMPRQLSPLQRQIARAIWSGADVKQISERFSRSLYTIERQVAAVYEAFGVSSRPALLQAAHGLGLA